MIRSNLDTHFGLRVYTPKYYPHDCLDAAGKQAKLQLRYYFMHLARHEVGNVIAFIAHEKMENAN